MRKDTRVQHAIILKKSENQENYITYQSLCEEGIQQALQRKSSKNNTHSADLFDLVENNIDFATNGAAFIKETKVIKHFSGISKNYTKLRSASEWSQFLLKNLPLHEASEEIFILCYNTFNALHNYDKSYTTLFKSYYSFAKFEGYPIKELWYEKLNTEEKSIARNLLSLKLELIDSEENSAKTIHSKLKAWLQIETDLFL